MKLKRICIILLIIISLTICINFTTANENITQTSPAYRTNTDYTNTIYINNSYTGNIEDGSQNHPYKTLTNGLNNLPRRTPTNIYIANGEYNVSKVITIRDSTLTITGESTNVILNGMGKTAVFKFLDGTYTISNIKFINGNGIKNRGEDFTYGGAIFINASGEGGYVENGRKIPLEYFTLNINNCIFTNNYADEGGAIFGENGYITIKNTTFNNNNAYYGAGISLTECNITINNTIFKNNNAEEDGGGFIIYNSIGTISNSNFEHNTAIKGGAGYISQSIININKCKLNNNAAKGNNANGGGLYIYESKVSIDHTIINANKVSGDYVSSSAIFTISSLGVIINNSIISNNTLTGDYCFGIISNKGFLIINNTEIYGNNINANKNNITDIIYNPNGIVKIENTEIKNNKFKGGKTKDLIYFTSSPKIFGNMYETNITLPEKYDLRKITLPNGTITSAVTSVKNQGNLGTCWAFGTLAALESHLKLTEGVDYDFSEINMHNLISKGNTGYDYDGEGGDFYLSIAYLTRWSGPINETDDPYDDNSKISLTNLTPAKHVQDLIFIPVRNGFTDLSQIKQAIMKYGAVAITISNTEYEDNILDYDDYYNYYEPLSQYSNHILTIVGWDDTYSKNNFQSKYGQPEGDGAFIIKNSWGEDSGDNGYYYVSYYDSTIGGSGGEGAFGLAFTNVENNDNYQEKYEYDPLGDTSSFIGYNNETAWFANIFTAISNNPLAAFSIITSAPNSEYYAKIYVNNELKQTTNGIINEIGYHTIKLDNYISLKTGDIFKIIVKLTTPGFYYPIAIETQIEDLSSNAHAQLGQSYISPDGEKWHDISQNTEVIDQTTDYDNVELIETNVCLKAFTAYGDSTILTCNEFTSSYGEIKNLTGTLQDINGNPIAGQHIKLKLARTTNGQSKTYDVVTDYRGIFRLEIHLGAGKYTAEATFEGKNNLKYSKTPKVNVIVTNTNLTSTSLILINYNTQSTYGKPINFTTKLITTNNTLLPNENIEIKLTRISSNASKTYTLTTNDIGEVSLLIQLATGQYTIQCTYKGTNKYDSSTNNCNLLITP